MFSTSPSACHILSSLTHPHRSSFRYEYLFNFDNTFEIHDDIEVLKRMGLAFGLEKGECSPENLSRAVSLLPKSLEPYVKQIASSGASRSSTVRYVTQPLYLCLSVH